MMFHYDTQSVIFLPNKVGSVSLRNTLSPIEGWVSATFPAKWNTRSATYHVFSDDVDRIHEHEIKRRILLFRNPTNRIASLWRYETDRGNISKPFLSFLRHVSKGPLFPGFTQQINFCPNHDDVIRTEKMAEDIERIFGEKVVARHDHVSITPMPEICTEAHQLMRDTFPDDFKLWESLHVL